MNVTLTRTDTKTVRVAGRNRATDRTLSTYEVHDQDGNLIGKVAQAVVTRESRTPGRRYVNARWNSVAWKYQTGTDYMPSRTEQTTRKDALVSLLESHGLNWQDARDAAEAATVAKPTKK